MVKNSTFGSTVIGQNRIKELLVKQLEGGTVSSSYLFRGLTGLGKAKLAREFALSLMCRKRKTNASLCGTCESCTAAKRGKGTLTDLYEVTLLENSSEISTDQIRDLTHSVSQTGFGNPSKVIILEYADRLSAGAANALLKVLEEPPHATHILLLDNKTRPMIETITSRCQILRFLPPSMGEIITWLTDQGLNKKIADELAFVAGGKPEKIRLYLTSPQTFSEAQNIMTMLAEHFENPKRIIGMLGFQEKTTWEERQEKARNILESYLYILRSALLYKLTIVTVIPLPIKIGNVAFMNVINRIRSVEQALSLLSYNVPGGILVERSLYA